MADDKARQNKEEIHHQCAILEELTLSDRIGPTRVIHDHAQRRNAAQRFQRSKKPRGRSQGERTQRQ
jgi:predicted AAA+ superfamily ATPase